MSTALYILGAGMGIEPGACIGQTLYHVATPQNSSLRFLYYSSVCLFTTHLCTDAGPGTRVATREQPSVVSSHALQREHQGSNSDLQNEQQLVLPTEPSQDTMGQVSHESVAVRIGQLE